jgi:hypothetical protein
MTGSLEILATGYGNLNVFNTTLDTKKVEEQVVSSPYIKHLQRVNILVSSPTSVQSPCISGC